MEIITSVSDLIKGDVLFIAKKLRNKTTGEEFWWRAFHVVRMVGPCSDFNMGRVEAVVLKMHPDLDKDVRHWDFNESGDTQVIQYLHPDDYPQGVAAMRIKMITLGVIALGDD